MQSRLQVTRIQDADFITRRRDEWDQLAGGIPFLRWDWLRTWWETWGAGGELYIVLVADTSGKWIGAAPWYRSDSLAAGRKIQLIGSGRACSDYQTLLSLPGTERAVAEAIADWMTRAVERPEDRWDLLELDNVVDADPIWKRCIERMETQGHAMHRRPAPSCWAIRGVIDWESYLKRLSKSHRKQIRRMIRQLNDDPNLSLRTACDTNSLNEGWRIFEGLHRKRRAEKGQGDGCFSERGFEKFLREVSERFLHQGLLRLIWLEDNQKPVAIQLEFIDDAGVFAYQAGIDSNIRDYSPGHVLQAAILHRCAVEGVERYDFLRGDEPYKPHWRAEATPCSTIRVTPPTTIAQLRSGVWAAGRQVKRWVASSLKRHEETPA